MTSGLQYLNLIRSFPNRFYDRHSAYDCNTSLTEYQCHHSPLRLQHQTPESKSQKRNQKPLMAIAAAIFISLPPQARRFSVPIAATFRSISSLHFNSLRSSFSLEKPNFRVSASSMSIGAPEKTSTTSFLDRRESGFLHFVKYHGLGNDFILVISLIHFS